MNVASRGSSAVFDDAAHLLRSDVSAQEERVGDRVGGYLCGVIVGTSALFSSLLRFTPLRLGVHTDCMFFCTPVLRTSHGMVVFSLVVASVFVDADVSRCC